MADNFESDVLDTVLVINSLLEENELDLETVKNGGNLPCKLPK